MDCSNCFNSFQLKTKDLLTKICGEEHHQDENDALQKMLDVY